MTLAELGTEFLVRVSGVPTAHEFCNISAIHYNEFMKINWIVSNPYSISSTTILCAKILV